MRFIPQLIVVGIALIASRSLCAEDYEVVGYIDGQTTGCTVTPANGQPEPASKDGLLHVLDQIQCDDGGQVDLRIGCEASKLIHLHDHHDPVKLAAKPQGSCDKRLAKMLTSFGATGGRERSTGNLLYSPLDQYAVTPGSLVLRWQPLPGRTLHFELRQRQVNDAGQRTDAILWKSTDVEGSLGTLTSPELREALARLAPVADDSPLMLWMLGTGSVDQVARFHLLSADEERRLSAELDSLKQLPHDAFIQHIARADLFKRYLLFPEAAQEYEAALKIDPDNSLLRDRAREVYEAMGDTDRAKEL